MKEFKVSKEQANIQALKYLRYLIPFFLIITVIMLITSFNVASTISDAILILVFLFIGISIGIWCGNKINVSRFSSYKIELFDNSIKKYQKYAPTIEINREDITSITENKYNGITIRTKNIYKSITIPVFIDQYSHLKELLSEWNEITTVKSFKSHLY